MEDFFHLSPPLSFFAGRQGILHRAYERPPFLGFHVLGHLRPISLEIRPVVFEISEKNIVLKEDRVVADIAIGDLAQHFGPNRRMIFLVLVCSSRLEPDHSAESLHGALPSKRSDVIHWTAQIQVLEFP